MAVRMRYLGVAGTVVNGRIRDLGEITGCGLPVSFPFSPLYAVAFCLHRGS